MAGFFDSLTNGGGLDFSDPNTMAMLSAVGTLGQLAMPTRMPTPNGAVLAQAAGMLGSGAMGAQDYRLKAGQANLQDQQLQGMRYMQRMLGFGGTGAGSAGGGIPGATPGSTTGGAPNAGGNAASAPMSLAGGAPSGSPALPFGGQDTSSPSPLGSGSSTTGSVRPMVDPALALRVSVLGPAFGIQGTGDFSKFAQSPPGYFMGTDGVQHYWPGGPADPNTVATMEAAKGWGGYGPQVAVDHAKYRELSRPGATVVDGSGNIVAQNPVMLKGTNPDGTQFTEYRYLNGGGVRMGQGTSAPVAPGTPIASDQWAGLVGQNESGGAANAQNPRSSAGGPAQFLDNTWLSMVGRERPDLMQGRTTEQVLALKNDPDLARELTIAYAADNAGALQMRGIPVNSATLGLAHGFGPGGAIRLANADPRLPMEQVMPAEVMEANPQYKGQTVGSVLQGYVRKYTLAPVDFGQRGAQPQNGLSVLGGAGAAPAVSMRGAPAMAATPASATAPAGGPAAGAFTATPLPAPAGAAGAPQPPVPRMSGSNAGPAPAGAPGAPAPQSPAVTLNEQGLPVVRTGLSPLQHASQEKQGAELEEYGGELVKDAQSSMQNNFLLDQMKNDAKSWQMGKFADIEGDARAYLQSFAQMAGLKTPELDQKLADFQSFVKSAGNLTRTATREVSGRAAFQEMQFINSSLPSPEMSEQGFAQVASQMQAVNDYRIAKQQAADAWRQRPGGDGTLANFESTWNKNVTPAAFMVHRLVQENPGLFQVAASNMQGTDAGNAMLKRLGSEISYAKSNGLFDE